MLRRELLRAAAVGAFIGVSSGAAAGPSPRRRVRPGDLGWPSKSQWSDLGRAVGGRLSRPVSVLAPCEAAPKGEECRALLKQLQNPFFIQDQPSGTEVSGYFDAWTPAPSAYAVAAESAADVAAAVTFARAHDLRVVVKGGGHSYLGGSNAPDSLLIWTHPMRDTQLHDAFVPQGCEGHLAPTPAVSLGAGCRWIEAYDAVTTKGGRYVQGGGCTSVGVAGLVLGGGFGSYSKRYGTAASNLLEAEIVTADGAIRVVNPRQNPDLFWALKGGGGGSFGVVTRLTLRTHDAPTLGGGFEVTLKAASDEAFRRLIDRFLAVYADNLMNDHWGEQVAVTKSNTLKVTMVTLDLEDDAVMAAWKPLLDGVAQSGGAWTYVKLPDLGTGPFRGMWDVAAHRARKSTSMRYDDRPGAPPLQAWWDGDSGQVSAFIHGYDSMWLPRSVLEPARRETLTDALFEASRHFDVQLHLNKGLAGGRPDALARSRDTATNPDVVDAFALAIIATGGPPAYYSLLGLPSGAATARKNADAVKAAAAALRVAAPTAGSYISEADFFNADWRRAFWGRNYPRLRSVKAKYDPTGLFFVHHGVGSEDWSADGFTRVV
jgi:FAD/FMN-containing dehydrogenase